MATDRPGDASGRYLAVASSLTAAILLSVMAFTYVVKFRTDLTQPGALVHFQQKKLDRAGPVDTIFVGDSSLGNAISSEHFDRLTGTHSLNVALMGLFGYSGSYNMIRRALMRHPEVRNVVVMETPGMMSRDVAYDGYVLSAPDLSLSNFPLDVQGKIVKSGVKLLLDRKAASPVLRHVLGKKPLGFENDYVAQGPGTANKPIDPHEIGPVNPEKSLFLKAIVELCRDNRLNCVYAQGPIRADVISSQANHIRSANQAIRATGIVLAAPDPLPLSGPQIGDSPDHVAPAYKLAATSYYAIRLKPYLLPTAHGARH